MFLPSVEVRLVFRHEEEAAIFTELGQNSLPFTGYKVDKFWGSCFTCWPLVYWMKVNSFKFYFVVS